MTPHYETPEVTLWHGDCLDVLRTLPDASVDDVVTEPPYGLELMGKEWDAPWKADGSVVADPASVGGFQDGNGGNPYSRSRIRFGVGAGFQQWCEQWTAECLRVLKPGGHLLAFGGTRTWHRLAVAVEDAGFEIRDSIAWMYGSGFPKSLDVSKAIDKAAGAERKVVGRVAGAASSRTVSLGAFASEYDATTPATDAARTWQGWGTALKPAFEPIVVARKPLAGTVAGNVLAHGTGALNIDGCRVEHASEADRTESVGKNRHADFGTAPGQNNVYGDYSGTAVRNYDGSKGRWPANVVLDEDQAAALDEQSGESQARIGKSRGAAPGDDWGMTATGAEYDDLGGASRFYYVAKADASERPKVGGVAHPTVKPIALMRWLVRLVTPPGGIVLEPFAGSGTTVEACLIEGFRCVAIEKTDAYLPLIEARIHRRRDPVAAARLADNTEDSLFDLLDEAGA